MKNRKKAKLNLYVTLIIYALVPLIVAGTLVAVVLTERAKKLITSSTQNYMLSMVEAQGANLNDIFTTDPDTALTTDALTSYCQEIKLRGMDSSYCYVADANGTMLWHPTKDKIGQPVTNSVILGVCEKMSQGVKQEASVVSYEYKGEIKYAAYYVSPECDFVFVLSADEKEALAGTDTMQLSAWTIDILLIIIAGALALLFARLIASPLKALARFTKELADGNLNAEISTRTNIKETRALLDSVDELQVSLQNAVGTVKESAMALSEAVVDVDEKTAANAESMGQINSAVGEVSETSQSVAESAQQMSEKAIDLGNNIDRLTNNVENLKNASDEINKANEEATQYMNTVLASSNESVDAVGTISEKIGQTNEAIERISRCVQMIEDIAAQTNLLSLNASIEAARAGEAGRGFAVVAEEIRTLADDSKSSAGEIKNIVDEVIAISGETVKEAEHVTDIIAAEQKYIADTQGKFEILSESVQASIQEINEIKNMTGDLEAFKNELTEATSDLGAISEELGASAEEVSASCSTVAEACTETQARTEEMRAIGEHLNEAISVFKL